MSYIGNIPTTAAFPFDQFSGNGTTTAFTLTYAPASTTSIIVSISGVVQNPNTYSVIGTTLTFSPAPPTGTNNIAVLYLGLPVIGTTSPGNTAYFSSSSFTATGGQTTFTPSGSYQVGFVRVMRNGSTLAPADYTATNGTTVTLNNPCVAGDVVVIEVFNLVSIANALPLTGGTVTGASQFNSTLSVNGAFVSGFTGFKNRIINGDMRIDQRNNGAALTVNSGTDFFPVDRFLAVGTSSDGVFTVQRSTVSPAGFTNSLLATVTTADSSIGTLEQYYVSQIIEGFNVADLAWGTSSAQAVTLSFVVRSSVTGTFGGSIRNSATDRSYPFTFTINSANTFETKTVTIPGDTSGTWLTNNGVGMHIIWALGMGSSRVASAGAWTAGNFKGASGATQWISTNGATFYITGVQLERGSNATSFEFRSIGQELQLCQRYFYAPMQANIGDTTASLCNGFSYNSTLVFGVVPFPVTMRTSPSVSSIGGSVLAWTTAGATYGLGVLAFNEVSPTIGTVYGTSGSGTTGYGGWIRRQSANGYVNFSAEL